VVVSRDLGDTWTPITGTNLARLTVNDLEASHHFAGVSRRS